MYYQMVAKDKFISKVEGTIRGYKMLTPGDSVLGGISGGPDSSALLHALVSLSRKYRLKIGVAHIDHSLRGAESDRDALFVSELAKKYGLPFFLIKKDIYRYSKDRGLSLEEAGREVRYRFFKETAKENGYSKIALGHNADDNAESVLMYLLRGSGPLGVSGIPAVREGCVIRPLIQTRRCEITDYLDRENIPHVFDSSNREEAFLRNNIRLNLIPLLQASYNPNIVESLNRFSHIIQEENLWMEQALDPVFDQCLIAEEDGLLLAFSLKLLGKEHVAVQRRLMRKAVLRLKGDLRRISFTHVESLLKMVADSKEGTWADLPGGIKGETMGGRLFLHNKGRDYKGIEHPSFEYAAESFGDVFIKETGRRLSFSKETSWDMEMIKRAGKRVAYFDMEKTSFPITIRNVKPGDRFKPFGGKGTRKLKKFFSDNKVPIKERRRCPILLSGGRIIWVAGHRADEGARVTNLTDQVLKIELFLAY